MDEAIHKSLGKEISGEIKKLGALTPGSEEHTTAVESVAKLYKLMIDETKTELEFAEKREQRAMEAERHKIDAELKAKQIEADTAVRTRDLEQKDEQLLEQIKDRCVKLGIQAAELILPLMFYASWMKKGLKFEETGTFTSATFRGLFSRFRPTKK